MTAQSTDGAPAPEREMHSFLLIQSLGKGLMMPETMETTAFDGDRVSGYGGDQLPEV
jgi:hypothetical protein